MVLKNLQVNTIIVGVDEILAQIREIKKLQKSQLVMKRFWINHKNLTMYMMLGCHIKSFRRRKSCGGA
jgi:hypothetical protein